MGSSRWSSDDYTAYASTTGYVTAQRHEVFRNEGLPKALDPRNIAIRESCDSVDNPNSTPIILALDVTGSMGSYAEMIAKEELPKLMGDILEQQVVSDPHLMFMGIDDVHASARGPLQVSQFEADIRILEQLREIWLVSGGGGNRSESYDLAWYFAAHKTVIESYTKRGKKGFLFTFGDEEAPYENLTEGDLRAVFDGQVQACTPAEALAAAKKMYHVFHVVIEQGSYFKHDEQRVRDSWTKLMGNNVLFLKDFRDLSTVVTTTMRIAEGADIDEVVAASANPRVLRHAFSNWYDSLE